MLIRRLFLLCALLGGGCGWLDPEPEEDPFDAVRNVCPHFASILYEYGSTLAGPYSRLAFSDFAFTRDDSGRVSATTRRDDDTGCASDLARRLAAVCESQACAQYRGGAPTLEGCLLEIEAAFYQTTPSCYACGDGHCEVAVEGRANCPQDCLCGDGTCQRTHGENLLTCGQDCPNACGDGICAKPFEGCTCAGDFEAQCSLCALDCCDQVCGDAVCSGSEDPDTCEQDCGTGTCGDTKCRGLETILNCPLDCSDVPLTCITDPLRIPSGTCGDELCTGCEMWTCPRDCTNAAFGLCADPANPAGCPERFCGDATCDGAEDAINCPADCDWPGAVCGNARCDREDYYAGCPQECPEFPFCGDGVCLPGEPMVWFFGGLPLNDLPAACADDCGYGCQPTAGGTPLDPTVIQACTIGRIPYCVRGSLFATTQGLMDLNSHVIVRCEQGCDEVEYCHGACATIADDPQCVDCAITRAGRGHLLCGDADAPTCLGPNLLWRCAQDPLAPTRAACDFRQQVYCGAGCEDGACTPCGDNPSCPGGTTCEEATGICQPICGDAQCVAHEDPWSCAADCARCGDNICSSTEALSNCPIDCHCDGACDPFDSAINCPPDFALCACGDGVCNAWEIPNNTGDVGCPQDCAAAACGDGLCEGREVMRVSLDGGEGWCAQDCPLCNDLGVCGPSSCGDGICNPPEYSQTCPEDCFCGDGICGDAEHDLNCPQDCQTCGNNVCDPLEDNRACRRDCRCGDNVCKPGENNANCPEDCRCGDGLCDPDEYLLGGRTPCAADCE